MTAQINSNTEHTMLPIPTFRYSLNWSTVSQLLHVRLRHTKVKLQELDLRSRCFSCHQINTPKDTRLLVLAY